MRVKVTRMQAGVAGMGLVLATPVLAVAAGVQMPVWSLPYLSVAGGAMVAVLAGGWAERATAAPALPAPKMSDLDALADAVLTVEPGTLRIDYANRVAVALCAARVPATLDELLGEDAAEALRLRMRPLLTREAAEITAEAEFGGTHFEIRAHLDDDGRRVVLVMRDVSERRAQEGAQGEVLAAISHELRTPMTSVKGAMGLLLSNAAGELPERARDMLSIAYRNADRMVAIINDILDIEKIAAGQMEFDLRWAPLARVIEEAVAANEQFADRFDVTVDCQGVAPHLHAMHDFGRTLQVLTNLLSNAAKFSPPGGRVNVTLTREDDRVRVSVQDFGPGIPEHAQARIFERFSQVDNGTRNGVAGTGLGLNIARAIMEKQNGSIGVDSRPGEGSVFFVEFPAGNPDLADRPAQLHIVC